MKKIIIAIAFILLMASNSGAWVFYETSATTYLTNSENETALNDLCTANSTWECKTGANKIGTSYGSKNINAVIVNPTGYYETFLMDAGTHGYEISGQKAALDFLNYLSANPSLYTKIRWIVVPKINPDASDGQKIWNNHGVNINRNFSAGWGEIPSNGVYTAGSATPGTSTYMGASAGSEPETQVMMGLLSTYLPERHLNQHSNMNSIGVMPNVSNWIFTTVNALYSANGLSQILHYYECTAFGTYYDYSYAFGTIEPYIWEDNGFIYSNSQAKQQEQTDKWIGFIKAWVDKRRYYNSGAIRVTASSATNIGDTTYSAGVLSSIGLTQTAGSQNLEITGYKGAFAGATSTVIDYAASTSTVSLRQGPDKVIGVPMEINATSGSLTIAVIDWGDRKKWSESSSSAPSNPVHIISGFTAGQAYKVSVSGAEQSTITGAGCSISNGYNYCTADADGKITFTYAGSYSSHDFQIGDAPMAKASFVGTMQ